MTDLSNNQPPKIDHSFYVPYKGRQSASKTDEAIIDFVQEIQDRLGSDEATIAAHVKKRLEAIFNL